MESLKCWPCKRCEKRAIEMKSTLLLSCSDKREEVRCQTVDGGEYQQSAKQVTCITEFVGPSKNGRSNESWGELSVTAGDPLVEGSSNIESSSKIISSQRCDEVEKREPCERGEDPQSLVRLRTGSSKVESRRGLLNGEYLKRETTRTELQSELRQGRHWGCRNALIWETRNGYGRSAYRG